MCSDGFVQTGIGEECDAGVDNADNAACTTECKANVCGDGKLYNTGEGSEACDNGAENGPGKVCNAMCALNVCGDGDQGPDEACDDGNNSNTDACLVGCILAGCGDGFQHVDVENCDAGADNGAYDGVCNATCDGPGPSCGDGVWDQPFELCDGDGAPSGTDCESGCKPVCEFAKYDCNGDLADGCQALLSDKHNCGACGKKCPNFCVLGTCY